MGCSVHIARGKRDHRWKHAVGSLRVGTGTGFAAREGLHLRRHGPWRHRRCRLRARPADDLITTAQATTVLGVPLIGALLLLLAMDGKRLGSLKLDPVRLVVCGFGLAFLIVLATSYAGALLGQ